MIDNTRIASGYDYEILLGEEYILTVLQAMYDVGQIPSTLQFGQTTVEVERPSSVQILPAAESADIAVTVPYAIDTVAEAVVIISLTLEATEDDGGVLISSVYQCLDSASEALLSGLGVLEQVETTLRQEFDQSYWLKSGQVPVAQVRTKRIPTQNDYQAAFGLYINKTYKIAPPPGPPESSFIERGDLEMALSFLPSDQSFAIGAAGETLRRLAANKWHSWGVQKSDGSWEHPLIINGSREGKYRSISIASEEGVIRTVIKAEKAIENWFDADLKIVLEVRPRVRQGRIEVEIKLADFDADTGILADLVAAFVGGLLVGIVAAITGGTGAIPAAAAIGSVGSVFVYEIGEQVVEELKEDTVEEETEEEGGIAELFESLPTWTKIGSTRQDNFFKLTFYIAHRYAEATVNEEGASFGGVTEIETNSFPVDVELIDRTRGSGPDSFFGLESLIYRIKDRNTTEELAIQDVLQRIPARQLKKAILVPRKVRRKESVITEIQFDTGIDLKVQEAIALQERNVLSVSGCQLIRPRNARPYFRDTPDSDPENNLESLPSF
jgi:xanthosine utilization system XapX-like protein